MSRKGAIKTINFRAVHSKEGWRKSLFEYYDEALNDDEYGAKALLTGQHAYINGRDYGKPLYVIVWDSRCSVDAVVLRKRIFDNEIIKKNIPLKIVDVFEQNNSADLTYLKALFDDVDNPKLSPHYPLSIAKTDQDDLYEDIAECIELDKSEQERLITARIGQGKFRKNVIRVWGSKTCALTLTPVNEMLIASHIKAWRNCENTTERLDGANGILLCAHIDKLFDKHRITFRKVGREFRLKLADDLDRSLMAQLGLNEGDALAIGRMNKADFVKFEDYLSHHEKIFCQLNDINML